MQISLGTEKPRLEVRFNQYLSGSTFQSTLSMLRAIGARWDHTRQLWWMPKDIPSAEILLGAFPLAQVELDVKDWMMRYRAATKGNMAAKHGDAEIPGMVFKSNPRKHQKTALGLMIRNKQYALCCEMGTGKSAVIIYLIDYLKSIGQFKRALIVAPLSVVPNWPNEARKHSDNLTCSLLVGDKYQRIQALEKEADIYVINYAGIRTMADTLARFEWDVMVCDESQNIKNRTAIQSKVCYAIGQKAQRRYILTGTLVTNKPLDVFGQFRFLRTDILGSNYFAFQSRYAVMNTYGTARFPVAFKNLDELSGRIAPWNYRVLKSECLDLPPKVYQVRYAEFHPETKAVYKSLSQELAAELKSGEMIVAPIILTKLLRFQQLTAGFVTTAGGEIKEIGNREKIRALLEALEECEGKCVVWVKFRKEMEMVKAAFMDKGINHVSLSGSDSAEERALAINRFNGDDAVKVFVGQVEAGGTGINLTAASVCIYMTNSYSLGTRLQSEDRLHRMGSEIHKSINYIDIVVPDTIDEKILAMLKEKKDIADIINQDRATVLDLIGGAAHV